MTDPPADVLPLKTDVDISFAGIIGQSYNGVKGFFADYSPATLLCRKFIDAKSKTRAIIPLYPNLTPHSGRLYPLHIFLRDNCPLQPRQAQFRHSLKPAVANGPAHTQIEEIVARRVPHFS